MSIDAGEKEFDKIQHLFIKTSSKLEGGLPQADKEHRKKKYLQ